MTTATSFDQYLERVSRGDALPLEVVRELTANPDILPLGMLADAMRDRLHGRRATFLRVASLPWDGPRDVPTGAKAIRLSGAPDTLDAAVAAVATARAAAGSRTVSAFAWGDVTRWAEATGQSVGQTLAALRAAGLDEIAGLSVDRVSDVGAMVEALAAAGFSELCLQVDRPGAADRVDLWATVDALQQRLGCVRAISPLPGVIAFMKPTTGYDDVKMLASARLAAPHVPSVQVDWAKYGPKLAQVALTFGADDVDNVSGSDEAPEGRRRAPLEEIRRNIQAAGLEAVERDGRFTAVTG